MTRSDVVSSHLSLSNGDAAVDGLLAGAGAGVAMGLYLALAGLLGGQGAAGLLRLFDPAGQSAAVGGLLHVAVAGIYGLLFSLAWRWLGPLAAKIRGVQRMPAWLPPMAYGLVLLLIARAFILPGPGQALQAIGWPHLTLAHLIYGAVLGWLLARQQASRASQAS